MNRSIVLTVGFAMLALASISFAQKMPSSIRGYKVRQAKVHAGNEPGGSDAAVKVGDPRIVDVGLAGITLEATAEISGLDQDGRIDFLTFRDITVNGIQMDIEEYQHPFELRRGQPVKLSAPIRGTVSSFNVAKAAYQEATATRSEWRVTGTVFVFGQFKKIGFTFKRVIPVSVTLTIPNPLKSLASAAEHP